MKKIMNMALCVLAFVFASVTVFAQNPVVSFKPTKTVVCPGKTSSFVNNSYVVAPATSVKSFKWTFGPSCVPSEDTINWNPQNVIFSGGGTVYVMLEVVDDLGQKSNYGVYIIVPYYNSSPQIHPQNIKTMCAGDSVALSVQAGFSGTYQWTLNNANISGATDSTYVVKSDGYYGCNVSDANGCSWGTWRYVQYNQTLNPKITAWFNNNGKGGPSKSIKNGDVVNLCMGDYLQANTQFSYGSPYVTVAWSNGDVGYNTTIDTIGTYSYTVSNNGCTEQSDTFTVAMLPLPVPVVTAPSQSVYCDGDTLPVLKLVNNGYTNIAWGVGGQYYTWNTSLVDSLIVSSSGSYGVLVTDVNGCSDTSATYKFTFNPTPNQPIISPTEFPATCHVWTSNAPGCTYAWKMYDVILPMETTQYLDVSKYGSGYFKSEVTNSSGCVATSDPVWAECTVTGLAYVGNGKHSVNFSCNPARESVTVYMPEDSDVLLVSSMGTIVRSEQGQKVTLDLRGIQPGVYIVRTVSKDGKTVGSQKLSVQ